ncbi:MAG: carbohydrate binding family 9 domain-containing protein [Acidobacteriota bacterium]|nr:carbohydrate binding family 9 domain-containing protein [Acidobacteriota bacterium]
MKYILLISIVGLLSALNIVAKTPSSPPNPAASDAAAHTEKSRPVRIPQFEIEPVIDGRLTDKVWQSSVILKDFYQLKSGVNVPSSVPTEVMLGYSSKYLYVAFLAYDEPNAAVKASLTPRDEIFEDDNVRIVLDTFNDKQKAYVFAFNPLGVIADGILTEGVGEDYSVNIPVEAKGRLTEAGYVVEAAIPFKSLKYKAEKNSLWGINVFRHVKSLNDEVNSWMPISPDKMGQLSQSGKITGLENLFTGATYEVVSTVMVSQNQLRLKTEPENSGNANNNLSNNTGIVSQPLKIQPGFSAKLNLTPSLSFKIAVNPGYLAGTEIFQTSTYLQRRREAFDPDYAIKRTRSVRSFALDENYLESLNNFQTPLQNVNKYAVVNPEYVVEVSGKIKSNAFDLLLAKDPAPGNFSPQELEHPQLRRRIDRFVNQDAYLNAFRVRRDVGDDSRLGLTATNFNFGGTRSYSAGFDGRLRFDDSSFVNFQIQGVNSKRFFFEPDLGEEAYRTGNGFGYYLSYEKQKRNFGYSLSAEGRTKYYRADLGFTRRFNYNRNAALVKYKSDTNPEGKLVAWRVSNLSDIGYDWQSRLRYWNNETKLDLDLPRETYLSFSYGTGYERLFEEDFGARRTSERPGAFIGDDPERSTRFNEVSFYGESTPIKRVFVSAFASYKQGEFDLDYDAGPRFLRTSPAAILDPDAPLDPNPGSLFYFESSLSYRPAAPFQIDLNYYKSRLERSDNKRLAFDDNTVGGRFTYNLTKSSFFRTRIDYSTLTLRMRSQFIFGLTNPTGKSLYIVYNGDYARAGYGPFFAELSPYFRQNGQTFLVKVSYPIFGNIKK